MTTSGYVMHSSIEMGYRFTDRSGSDDMYDTLVNLQTGPRFLNQTLFHAVAGSSGRPV